MEPASIGGHGMLSTLAIHSSCAEIWQWVIERKYSIKIIKIPLLRYRTSGDWDKNISASSPVITLSRSCFFRPTDARFQNKHQAAAVCVHQTKFVAPSLLKLSSFPNLLHSFSV
jgi:hypothetical protein